MTKEGGATLEMTREGALRSEFIMRVATLTTVDESGVGFSVVTGLMAGTGDGLPPRIGVRGRLFAGTTGGGVAAVYFRSNDYGLVKAAWGDENGAA